MYFCGINNSKIIPKMKPVKLSDFELNKENPFAKQALVNIGNAIVSKSVKTANKDEAAVLKAVDNNGEILGNSVFIRSKSVDSETFAKFFIDGFKAFFDLKPTSIKVFKFILSRLQPNRDDFMFFLEDCIRETGCGRTSVFRALGDLCRAGIIARGRTEEQYYINPMCVFNGDRVTFATTYINDNYPQYQTSTSRVKGTIDLMQKKGLLPSKDEKNQDKEGKKTIKTMDLFEGLESDEYQAD